MAFNIDESPLSRDWIHSKWNMPIYKSDAFFNELSDMQTTLTAFKQTAMYKTAVSEGKIVNDKWVPVKNR